MSTVSASPGVSDAQPGRQLIRAAIVDRDPLSSTILAAILQEVALVERTILFEHQSEVIEALSREDVNALFIDIFSVGITRGLSLITEARESFPHVPICLTGSTAQLTAFPEVPENWKKRFGHFYKLPKDHKPDIMHNLAVIAVEKLQTYLLSKKTAMKLRDVRALLQHATDTSTEIAATQRDRIEQTLAEAAETIEARVSSAVTIPIIPSFDDKDVQTVVKSTLEQATRALHRGTLINTAVLGLGGLLVVASFVAAVVTGSTAAIAFGGFGVAGIVAALITNPLKTIGSAAQTLVQVQVAYLGFLSQLQMLNQDSSNSGVPATLIERSKQLAAVTSETLKTLKE